MACTKMLYIKYDNNGVVMRISPSLIISGNDIIIVDVGMPGRLEFLDEALAKEGYGIGDITKVIVTHHDHDHFGALAELKRRYPAIVVIASEIEVPYLEGAKKSLRLSQVESAYEALPDERKEWSRNFQAYLSGIETVKVDVSVKDGDVVDGEGNVSVVSTPGHMPGHISIYVSGDNTLVAGDALIVQEGQLQMANPQFSFDLEEVRKSTEKLLDFDIDRIICYHGGLVEGGIKAALEGILWR